MDIVLPAIPAGVLVLLGLFAPYPHLAPAGWGSFVVSGWVNYSPCVGRGRGGWSFTDP